MGHMVVKGEGPYYKITKTIPLTWKLIIIIVEYNSAG